MMLSASSAMAISSEEPAFTEIKIEEIPAPNHFQNSRRYLLTYYKQTENSFLQVFPTLAEKERDHDLILAKAVRQYLEDEYHQKNKGMDEHVVEPSNKGEIFDLVAGNYLSSPWKDENINALRQYVNRNFKYIKMFVLNVYLDYSLPGGKYNYGNDFNPVLLKFGKKADQVIFIQVNYSDK
jgi:hypothetical protein